MILFYLSHLDCISCLGETSSKTFLAIIIGILDAYVVENLVGGPVKLHTQFINLKMWTVVFLNVPIFGGFKLNYNSSLVAGEIDDLIGFFHL